MDLFTLAAKIELDDSSYKKGVQSAENMGRSLAGKVGAMTIAVGNLAADMVKKGVSAISNVVKGAVDGFADYQQLIGGVETLFKSSATKVANYAKQSYKTTGLSANQYMETVTSFSASLLQGLGGDTEAAADLANTAITDMADNANKMGTDIASIQTAYQGFAKQNYTMLDNLKLGYGGTAKEMVRLINDSGILEDEIEDLDGITFDQLIAAIHAIQTQMGITGTTAQEAADTISGSKASLKAAWEDLLTAVGGEGDQTRLDESMENFKTSFTTYMENFIPTLVQTVTNSGSLVTAIAEGIASLPTTLLSEIGEGAIESGTEMIGGLSNITSWLIDSISNMFRTASKDPSKIAEFGKAIGDFLGTAISDIVANAPDILQGIIDVGINLAGGLIEGLFQGLFGEGAEVDKVKEALEGSLEDADIKATKSSALIEYLRTLHEEYGNAAKGTLEWKEAVKELENYIPTAGTVIDNFGGNVSGAIDLLDILANKMRETAVNAALMTALQDSYSLLVKQNLQYRKEEARYERNKAVQDNLKQQAIDAIKENAQAQLDAMSDEEKASNLGQARANKLKNLAAGFDDVTGENALENFSLGDLGNVLSQTLDVFSILDKYGQEVDVSTFEDIYDQAQKEMNYAKQAMEDSQKEIAATEKEIADVKVAVEKTSKDLGTSFNTASTDVTTGGDSVETALVNVAGKIASVKIPGSTGGHFFTPEAASGIDTVPYNNFFARLHKGEAVLTRAEADSYRSGSGTAEVVGAIQSLNNNIQNMRLVVGRKTFGRAVVDYSGRRVRNYIGQAESRDYAGYGT